MSFLSNWSITFTFLSLLTFPFTCFGGEIDLYESCGNYFSCGNLTQVGYPFWGGSRIKNCGHPELELTCEDNATAKIEINGMKYEVLRINRTTQIVTLAREDLGEGICLDEFENTLLDPKLFQFAPGTQNITVLYGCPTPYGSHLPGQFTCRINGVGENVAYPLEGDVGAGFCADSVLVPVLGSLIGEIGSMGLSQVLKQGFDANYKVKNEELCSECSESRGRCGFDVSNNKTSCICADGKVGYVRCSNTVIASATSGSKTGMKDQNSAGKSNSSNKILIGVLIGSIGLFAFVACLSLFILKRRRWSGPSQSHQIKDLGLSHPSSGFSSSNGFHYSRDYTTSPSTNLSQSILSYPSSKSELDNASFYYGVKVFNYDELEEATENFDESRELGDGGFGTVYYGKLQDGRYVAVKRLYNSSCKRMDQFRNEVKILANLRHRYLVTLYGCTSKRSKELLLVYEYIPNGTVADHLHGKKVAESSAPLPWSTRLSIAVQTAEALAFLHKSEVIHRDVKTTNILLDNDFQVKVADFGLSRLFPTDVTHVSTAPQGTPGYVDPEYYKCYHLTEKSDVYSFGVVLAELISAKPAVDITRHRHDINLSNMMVDRIKKNILNEMVDPALGYDEDYMVQKMVKLVGELAFRCLQEDREMRPCMEEVLNSLTKIQKQMTNSMEHVVVDIESEDDVGLLKSIPPPFSPETEVIDKTS